MRKFKLTSIAEALKILGRYTAGEAYTDASYRSENSIREVRST